MKSTAHAWLRLILAKGKKRAAIINLINQGIGVEHLVQLSVRELMQHGFPEATAKSILNPDAQQFDLTANWLEAVNHHLIAYNHEYYPSLLAELDNPPLALFCIGKTELLIQPQIAIVGSRNATPAGLKNTREFAAALAKSGFIVTSGLASGVDSAAHTGALSQGTTIAVMGTAIDQIYPKSNRGLAEKINHQGLVVSEYPPGTRSNRGLFPARNRIISGLSLGVLVTEASVRSGSLITARHAMEQNREVFALPGSIHNPLARGCHHLIRQGAFLVEQVDEIVQQLKPVAQRMAQGIISKIDHLEQAAKPQEKEAIDPEYSCLMKVMTVDEPITFDEIVSSSGLTADSVSSMLLIMELDGHVQLLPGGKYALQKN